MSERLKSNPEDEGKPESVVEEFSAKRQSLPEVIGRRIERAQELGLKPGDTIIMRDGSQVALDAITYSQEMDGGGGLECSIISANTVVGHIDGTMKFEKLVSEQDSIVDIRRWPDQGRLASSIKPLDREKAEMLWKQFEEKDIWLGDVLHSDTGTLRTVTAIEFNQSSRGGKIYYDRRTVDGRVSQGYRSIDAYLDNESSGHGFVSVDRDGRPLK